jgi:hypothetical protein
MTNVSEYIEQYHAMVSFVTMLGVLYLVFKESGFKLTTEGIGASALGFDSHLTSANQLSSQRQGMLGSAEPPVFHNVAFDSNEMGNMHARLVAENTPDVSADVVRNEGLTVGRASQAGYTMGPREGLSNLNKALTGY